MASATGQCSVHQIYQHLHCLPQHLRRRVMIMMMEVMPSCVRAPRAEGGTPPWPTTTCDFRRYTRQKPNDDPRMMVVEVQGLF